MRSQRGLAPLKTMRDSAPASILKFASCCRKKKVVAWVFNIMRILYLLVTLVKICQMYLHLIETMTMLILNDQSTLKLKKTNSSFKWIHRVFSCFVYFAFVYFLSIYYSKWKAVVIVCREKPIWQFDTRTRLLNESYEMGVFHPLVMYVFYR